MFAVNGIMKAHDRGNPPIRSASGCGCTERRLWPGISDLTPMLTEWAPVPTVMCYYSSNPFTANIQTDQIYYEEEGFPERADAV